MTESYRCSFAGVPFRTPTKEILAALERYDYLGCARDVLPIGSNWPGTSLSRLGCPQPLDYPDIRIGDYFYPVGASRWSIYRGIATAADVAAMKAVVWPTSPLTPLAGTFVLKGNPQNPLSTSVYAGGVSTSLYMLPPQPITGDWGDGELFIVTLVDERYFFQWNAGVALNTASQTWNGMKDALATALGISWTGTSDTGLTYYPEADSPFFSNHERPAVLLDALAANTYRVVTRLYDGTYQFCNVSNLNALDGDETVGKLVFGGTSYDAVTSYSTANEDLASRAVMPRYVLVTFPKWVDGAGYYQPLVRDQFRQDSYGSVWTYQFDVQAYLGSYPSGYFSGSVVCKTSAKARYSTSVLAAAGGDPDSAGNLAKCRTVGADIGAAIANQRLFWNDSVYAGIYPHSPIGSNYRDMLFAMRDSGPVTRHLGTPLNHGWSEFFHSHESPSLEAAQQGLDLSGRSGSIADVTALQILRGVVSGTASAAVFTPDDASETLPGDWKAAATQTLAGGKTINRFTALTGPVVSIGNNGIGSTTDPSFYAEGAIFIGNAANGFNASHALAMYFDDTTGFSLIQHADSSGGTSIDMREALAGVSASGGVVSIGGTAPTFYCRVIQASLKFKVGAGAGADGVTGTGGGGDTVVGGIITALGSGPTITNLTYSGSQAATGDISPAQLVANTNDWNPTGW